VYGSPELGKYRCINQTGLVKMAFYYAFYYAILFFTTLFTTLREAPTNDLMFFGTFQTASTVCSNKFSFLLLKKSFELKYQGSRSVVSTFGRAHRFPFSLKW
jgi:hypothetical protein